jgi:hypothetical protein
VNVVFKSQIKSLEGKDLKNVMVGFKIFCGFPSIHVTIVVTYIHIYKPQVAFAGNNFFFKFKTYDM